MESRGLVAFDDRLLRPSGDALSALVDSIADIDARRPTPDRFASRADAVRFDAIRRRLHEVLAEQPSTEERRSHARLSCDLWVMVSHDGRVRPGVIDDLGAGGVFVSTLVRPAVGERIDLVIEPREDFACDPLQVRARVAWLGTEERNGFGAAFVSEDGRQDRTIDRLVCLLVRRRVISPPL